jgi:hypothetical protein
MVRPFAYEIMQIISELEMKVTQLQSATVCADTQINSIKSINNDKDCYILRCDGVQSAESRKTFRWNISPPSSGLNNKQRRILFITTVVTASNPTSIETIHLSSLVTP